jgi:transposase InsO family protein
LVAENVLSDNGNEFTIETFREIRVQRRIKQSFTSAETPSLNPTVERYNGILKEMTKTMIHRRFLG